MEKSGLFFYARFVAYLSTWILKDHQQMIRGLIIKEARPDHRDSGERLGSMYLTREFNLG